jgi:hypothetical protein
MNPIGFIEGNLNEQRYHDEILRPIVVPFISCHQLFQHDNALPHVTRPALCLWSAHSPEMSPIEQVQDALD